MNKKDEGGALETVVALVDFVEGTTSRKAGEEWETNSANRQHLIGRSLCAVKGEEPTKAEPVKAPAKKAATKKAASK